MDGPRPPRSLKSRFVALVLGAIGFSTVLTSVLISRSDRQLYRKLLLGKGHGLCAYMAKISAAPLLARSQLQLDGIVVEAIRDPEVVYAYVEDADGRILTSVFSSVNYGLPWVREVYDAIPPRDAALERVVGTIDSTGRVVTVRLPVVVEDREHGRVAVGIANEPIRRHLAKNLLLVAAANAAALLLAFPLVLKLQGLLIRPIVEMSGLMRRISEQGDHSLRVKAEGDDEVAGLAHAFNVMLSRLEKAKAQIEEHNRTLEQKVEERTADLKSATAKLRQSEKMSAVGQLAAGVAHEINNPLGVILGFSQGALARLPEDSPLSLPLRSIVRESLRCRDLVQNLLTFSRAQKEDRRASIDLNDALESAFALIAVRAKTCGVELERRLGPGLPPVLAHKAQLQQVLINLANNAIDAMGGQGRLSIVTALSPRRAGHVVLQVRDTGAGIPEDIRERIFEPFFTTKDVGKGTGLGLALVYEIVQKHEGHIELDSEPGKGATFTVSLPVAPAAC